MSALTDWYARAAQCYDDWRHAPIDQARKQFDAAMEEKFDNADVSDLDAAYWRELAATYSDEEAEADAVGDAG